ncbi:hypothetical protein [Pseudonocardia sp. NPDC049154]|uniref:hypothetical protein n=1 Tax=Pseudonocardia sp. NPDC049154 TaxID=3155501 RepID=UPI00340C773C
MHRGDRAGDGRVHAALPRAAQGHVAQLRAYVESNVALVGEHPAAVRALIDIVRNRAARSPGVSGRPAVFEEHFRAGQEAGFRPHRTRACANSGGSTAGVFTDRSAR